MTSHLRNPSLKLLDCHFRFCVVAIRTGTDDVADNIASCVDHSVYTASGLDLVAVIAWLGYNVCCVWGWQLVWNISSFGCTFCPVYYPLVCFMIAFHVCSHVCSHVSPFHLFD